MYVDCDFVKCQHFFSFFHLTYLEGKLHVNCELIYE